MYTVYGLVDPRDRAGFYVGLTDDVYARFIQHLRCDGTNPAKDAKIHDLKQAGILVEMPAFERIEGLEAAKKREAYWIQHYHLLHMPLTNQVMPLPQEVIYTIPQEPPSDIRLGPRMSLSEQQRYIEQLCELDMPLKAICTHVAKYISADVVKAIFNKYQLKKVPQSTTFNDAELIDDLRSKMLLVLQMDQQPNTNLSQIIKEVWGIDDPGSRAGRAAKEELQVIRAYIAKQVTSSLRKKGA